MILVDSSVWIDMLRDARSASTGILSELEAHDDVVMGDIILMELLQGARDDNHAT